MAAKDIRVRMIELRLKTMRDTGYLDGMIRHEIYNSLSLDEKVELIIGGQAQIKMLMIRNNIKTSF